MEDVKVLLEFVQKAFLAREMGILTRPDGSVMHAEVQIGDSMLMMGEPNNEFTAMKASIYIYVEDCQAIYEQAIKAGGISVMPLTHMKHAGEKYGGIQDPAGNIWWIATHLEDISIEEEQRRIDDTF